MLVSGITSERETASSFPDRLPELSAASSAPKLTQRKNNKSHIFLNKKQKTLKKNTKKTRRVNIMWAVALHTQVRLPGHCLYLPIYELPLPRICSRKQKSEKNVVQMWNMEGEIGLPQWRGGGGSSCTAEWWDGEVGLTISRVVWQWRRLRNQIRSAGQRTCKQDGYFFCCWTDRNINRSNYRGGIASYYCQPPRLCF